MFGRLENHEILSLGGELGVIVALSWLVGAQVGAKRGKLTPLRGLKGTELELKGALGAPKEAQKRTGR